MLSLEMLLRLHDKLRLAETRDGASFYTLFGPAIQLGVVSRRKDYNDTIQYEKDHNAGFLSPFGYSTPTVKAAVDAICSMEWYCLLASKSQVSVSGNYPIRIWKWKGYLVQVQLLFLCTALELPWSIFVTI